jgi:iron(III) transport system ATP-binding protein
LHTDMISVESLVKRYEGRDVTQNAVDGLDIQIPEGQFVTLLGPSGCGKTTTLRMIAGLERPTSGSIHIGGVVMYASATGALVAAHRRPVGMVFQSYAVWPHMSVFENVAFPLRVQRPKLARAIIRDRVENALAMVGLEDFATRPGTALSGGQQQRAALARALVKEPQVLLLDEPLSNLDAQLRDRMREWIREVQERVGLTTVYVTHDQEEALAISDRILVMDSGRVVEDGSPQDIYWRPTNRFTAGFVGVANHFDGTVQELLDEAWATVNTEQGIIVCPASGDLSAGDTVRVFVRPEHLRILREEHNGAWAGIVKRRLFQGAGWDYFVSVGDRDVRVRLYDETLDLDHGDTAFVAYDRTRVIVVKTDAAASAPEEDF